MRILTCGFLVLLTACASAPTEQAAQAPTARHRTVAAAPAAQPVSAAGATSAAPVRYRRPGGGRRGQPACQGQGRLHASSRTARSCTAAVKPRPGPGARSDLLHARQLEAIEQATREAQDSMDRQRNSSGCGKFCSRGQLSSRVASPTTPSLTRSGGAPASTPAPGASGGTHQAGGDGAMAAAGRHVTAPAEIPDQSRRAGDAEHPAEPIWQVQHRCRSMPPITEPPTP